MVASRRDRLLEQVLAGDAVLSFRDLGFLLRSLGVSLARVSGSHHIYVHPRATRPINVQKLGKDAKPYQLRQLRSIVLEFGLRFDE